MKDAQESKGDFGQGNVPSNADDQGTQVQRVKGFTFQQEQLREPFQAIQEDCKQQLKAEEEKRQGNFRKSKFKFEDELLKTKMLSPTEKSLITSNEESQPSLTEFSDYKEPQPRAKKVLKVTDKAILIVRQDAVPRVVPPKPIALNQMA